MFSPTERCGRISGVGRGPTHDADVERSGIQCDRLSRLVHLVPPTQPPTEPFAGMLGYDPIAPPTGSLAKVVRPFQIHDAVELAYLFLRVPPAPLSVGRFANPAADRLNLSLRWTLAHIRASRSLGVAATKGVTQKIERFLWNLTNVRFLLVDRQFQLPKRCCASRPSPARRFGDSRSPDHPRSSRSWLRVKTLLVSQRLPAQNESPHVEVTQQRRDDASNDIANRGGGFDRLISRERLRRATAKAGVPPS